MAHGRKKGETGKANVDVGRRAALARLGLGVSVAYAAPVLLTLSSAKAGVAVGNGALDNHNTDKGGRGGSASNGSGASGGSPGNAGSGGSPGSGASGGSVR